MSAIETDILIVGAGPAGTTAAIALSQAGYSCVLADKEIFPRDKICGDALSGKTVEVLNKLNPLYLDEINNRPDFLGSWGVNFVAPDGNSLRVPFKTKKANTRPPGFIATRLDFDHFLFEKAAASKGVNVLTGSEIRAYTRQKDGYTATDKDGNTINARLVIACDGAYSSFAKSEGKLSTESEHNCFGLRTYYKGVEALDRENFIELHFIKDILPGYFWVFPLPDGKANVGAGIRADKMQQKGINLKKAFEKIVSEHPVISQRMKNAERIGDIKLYGLPLGSKKRKLSGSHYMLCGDAAQLIDPFTGEGIGNAMMSGYMAAKQAVHCLQQNRFDDAFMQSYDSALYHRLWSELQLSYRMQQLVNYPSLFNFVVRKANNNPLLSETISCMFEDLDMRSRLQNPLFYLKLLFS